MIGGPTWAELEFLNRSQRGDAPLPDDRDPVRQLLGLGQVVCRHDQRALRGAKPQDAVADQPRAGRIHRRGRFIEQQDGRIVQQCADQRQLLPHAFGELAEPAVNDARHADLIEQVLGPPPGIGLREPVDAPEEAQILPGAHAGVEAVVFGEQADASPHLGRLGSPHRIRPPSPDPATAEGSRPASGSWWSCRPRSGRAGRAPRLAARSASRRRRR